MPTTPRRPLHGKLGKSKRKKKGAPLPKVVVAETATQEHKDNASVLIEKVDTFLPIPETSKKIIWQPFPGPQMDFLMADEDEVLFSGGRGPLVYGEKVLLTTGFTPVEKVKIGDVIICPDNTTSIITDVPFDGTDECYEIEFIDGRKIQCGKDHIWPFEVSNRTLKSGSKRQRLTTTTDLYNRFLRYKITKTPFKLLIPLTSPIDYRKSTLTTEDIHPYVLGLLIGDGSLSGTTTRFTTKDKELVAKIRNLGYKINKYSEIEYGMPNLKPILRKYGLSGKISNSKFIPEVYKQSSSKDRLWLLRGLMDTDGYTGGNGAEYTTVSKQLAEDIQELVWSLGGKATISTKIGSYKNLAGIKIDCQKSYRLYISFNNNANIFNLKRKKDLIKSTYNGGVSTLKLRIVNIKPIGKKQCKCITISNPNGLFLTTNFIVTHNSGKSDCLLVDLLRYISDANFRGLILRRTMPAIKDLIRGAKEIYFQAVPTCRWKEQEKMFVFPSGATVDFGYLDSIDDCERYHGQEYSWLGIDEISQFPDISWYYKLKGSIRSPKLKTKIRCTSNPTGVGRAWVKEYWVDKGEPNTSIIETVESPFGKLKLTKKWIHSTIRDNPIMMQSEQYLAQLASLQEPLRSAWLEGSWDAVEGMAFPEFNKKIHTIDPFPIPNSWVKFRGIDWGYASPAVVTWCAVDYDNNIYIYRELAKNGELSRKLGEEPLTADRFARKVLELEQGESIKWGVMDASCWQKRGDPGPSIAEYFEQEGCFWRPSDRTLKQRETGKLELHRLLKVDEFTKKPKIFIFNTCKELIRCLSSLPVDESNPEDVDTTANDHAYDALRYALMSRPTIAVGWDTFKKNGMYEKPVVVDEYFGY